MPDAPDTVDFNAEAQVLLTYLEQALRGTDVFRPVFEAKDIEKITATTSISNDKLNEIAQRISGLTSLMSSAFGEMTRTFAHWAKNVNFDKERHLPCISFKNRWIASCSELCLVVPQCGTLSMVSPQNHPQFIRPYQGFRFGFAPCSAHLST